MTFDVDSVRDIEWSDTAFERLVLPRDQKELILTLIESQIANKDTFDDVIQGKGGFSILLHRLNSYGWSRQGYDVTSQWTTRFWKDIDGRVW